MVSVADPRHRILRGNDSHKTYRNLNYVGANQVHVLKAANDTPQLSRRPAAGLGGARGGCKGGIEGVDVDGQVDGVLGANAVEDALDDAVGADLVNLARLDDLEATVPVVLVVAGPAERRADAGVDVGVVGQEALLRCVVKVGAVVNRSGLRRGTPKHLGLPCTAQRTVLVGRMEHPFELGRWAGGPELTGIQVAVKVNDGDGAIRPVNGTQQGERDGVVAAERNDARKGLALLRRSSLIGVGGGTPREDVEVALLDLVQGPSIIISSISISALWPRLMPAHEDRLTK